MCEVSFLIPLMMLDTIHPNKQKNGTGVCHSSQAATELAAMPVLYFCYKSLY